MKTDDEIETLIGDIVERLKIDRVEIDTDLIEHPQLVWEISREVALALSERDSAKETCKRVRSALLADMFEDNPKLAKNKAEEEVESDTRFKNKRSAYLSACSRLERLAALKEAVVARGYALHNFASIACARMGFSDSISSNNQSGSLRDYRKEKEG